MRSKDKQNRGGDFVPDVITIGAEIWDELFAKHSGPMIAEFKKRMEDELDRLGAPPAVKVIVTGDKDMRYSHHSMRTKRHLFMASQMRAFIVRWNREQSK